MRIQSKNINIPVYSIKLEGTLSIPEKAKNIVIFVHGSGSSRFSPRNIFVAEQLQQAGIATLLFDLLTTEEDSTYENRFNIKLLAERTKEVTEWINKNPETKNFAIGYFGASTGAAAAIIAAADLGKTIKAVVSRGGRPDLANTALAKITTPTLLIVGGNDFQVIELNQEAFASIQAEKKLEIVPDATHLFEEPGTLEQVAEKAKEWFSKYFS